MEPIENFVDYLGRTFKNQLEEHFGIVDNPCGWQHEDWQCISMF
jgi:hypothetical protein|tara:strand:+ start:692 stop:823 length:132 start_codon:yes stop_codon:yes gene_type:complete